MHNGLPALVRVTKEIVMPEPDEPTSYTAAPPAHPGPQDELEDDE